MVLILSSCFPNELPNSASSIDDLVVISKEIVFSQKIDLLYKNIETTNLTSYQKERIDILVNYLKERSFKEKGFEINIISLKEWSKNKKTIEKQNNFPIIRPIRWSKAPSFIIEFKETVKSKNSMLVHHFAFGAYQKNEKWLFSVAYQDKPIPETGNDEFPLSEWVIKSKRNTTHGHEYVDSYGAMKGPYKFTHNQYFASHSMGRNVDMKSSSGNYNVKLEYLDKAKEILVIHYEDQFNQSMIEVFQSN